MLPTFVIGLREGLEASLIVGIIAAFLGRSGRRDLMRWVLGGVALAIVLCGAVGVGLYVASQDLPQRQQEGLETVVGAIAIAMVTYMVVWMKRHSRDLKKQLEGVTTSALAQGSAWALVGMAFLAVLREGFETAVFLVAAFNGSSSRGLAGLGAVLGVAVSIGLGYGIYRGGVRINLSRFFRVTGFVLVLVAAGLVQTAFRTAHEAGWLNWGQQATVDLSAVVSPGSVQSALITGILGIQPQPRLIEFVGWLLYLVPVGLYVIWPQGRGLSRRATATAVAAAALVVGIVAGALALFAPALPAGAGPVTVAAVAGSAPLPQPVTVDAGGALAGQISVSTVDPVARTVGATTDLAVDDAGAATVAGVAARTWTATLPTTTTTGTLTYAELAARGGGRLPLGVRATNDRSAGAVPVTETVTTSVTVATSAASGRVVDATWTATSSLVATGATGQAAVTTSPVTATVAPDAAARLVADARTADDAVSSREACVSAAELLGGVAVLLALVAFALAVRARHSSPGAATSPASARTEPAPAVTAP